MAAILNSAILNSAIFDSAILVFPLKVTYTSQDWFPSLEQKNFTHSFWLNLMMAAILNSVMLDSDTALLDSDMLLSSLRFTQKHSHSILYLTQTNSIWIKLIHSHLTWWWQPSWILPSWIWPSWIQPFCTKKLHSFILTQLDDDSHLEFCHLYFGHLGFSHLSISSQTHSHLPRLVPTISTEKTSLIHSDSNWWWQASLILSCWIKTLASWIQTPCYLLSDSLKNTLTPLWLWLKLIQSDSNISFSCNLMMAAILIDSDTVIVVSHTLLSSLRFTQKHSHSTLTLTQTNLIWLQLIHSQLTWWWQPSWILPTWIWPSWIQPS